MNLARGAHNFLEDWERIVAGRKPVGTESFRVGQAQQPGLPERAEDLAGEVGLGLVLRGPGLQLLGADLRGELDQLARLVRRQ